MSVMTRREPYRTATAAPSLAEPERRLWVAVLEAARDDVQLGGPAAERARDWLWSPATERQSFRWVCAELGVSASAIRRALTAPAPSLAPGR